MGGQVGDGGVLAAERAGGVAGKFDRAHAGGECVPQQEAAGEAVADAEISLSASVACRVPMTPVTAAEDAGLAAGGHQAGGRRGRVQAAIAGAAGVGLEDGELAVEAQHAAETRVAPGQGAGVGDQEAGVEIVAAVADQVVAGNEVEGIGGGEAGLVGFDRDGRVDGLGGGGGRADLGGADAVGGVGNLALEIGQVDMVVIDQTDRADAGGGEVEQGRAAEAAGGR